jgi:pimeloyl-ACP methyl ester carboxylesterase
MANASAEDLSAIPATVTIPTLLVYGSDDERAPRFVAERLHAAIGGSRLVVLDGVGHGCNLEAPDRVNAALRAFLAAAPI